MSPKRLWTVSRCSLWAAVVSVGFVGCGKAASSSVDDADQTAALQEVGEMYRLYVARTKKAPKDVKDFLGSRTIAPRGFDALKQGKVHVQWGVVLSDTSEEGSQDSGTEVLAYGNQVEQQGGAVLMKNRTIKKMTSEEFKTASKAGSK